MDFLKEIVKEIGSDYAQVAADKETTEAYIDTGSFIFNGLVSGSISGGVSSSRITAIAGELVLVKLTSPSLLSRIFWITIPMLMLCTSIQNLLSIKSY